MDNIQQPQFSLGWWRAARPEALCNEELVAALSAYEVVWRHAHAAGRGNPRMFDYLEKAAEDVAAAADGVAARLGTGEESLRAALCWFGTALAGQVCAIRSERAAMSALVLERH